MTSKTIVSEAGSLKGFDLVKWLFDDLAKLLKCHKDAVKIVLGAIISIMALYPETSGILLALGGATYVTTRILSLIDFYFSEVELK